MEFRVFLQVNGTFEFSSSKKEEKKGPIGRRKTLVQELSSLKTRGAITKVQKYEHEERHKELRRIIRGQNNNRGIVGCQKNEGRI